MVCVKSGTEVQVSEMFGEEKKTDNFLHQPVRFAPMQLSYLPVPATCKRKLEKGTTAGMLPGFAKLRQKSPLLVRRQRALQADVPDFQESSTGGRQLGCAVAAVRLGGSCCCTTHPSV